MPSYVLPSCMNDCCGFWEKYIFEVSLGTPLCPAQLDGESPMNPQNCSAPNWAFVLLFHISLNAVKRMIDAGLEANLLLMLEIAAAWFDLDGTARPLVSPCHGHPVSVITISWSLFASTALRVGIWDSRKSPAPSAAT